MRLFTTKRVSQLLSAFGEFVLPGIILVYGLLYWLQAGDRSAAVLAMPIFVTGAVGILVTIQLVTDVRIISARQAGAAGRPRGAGGAQPVAVTWSSLFNQVVFVAAVLVAIMLWRELGTFVGLFLAFGLLMFLLGERKPLQLLLIAALFALGIPFLFGKILTLPLPGAETGWRLF